MLKTYPKRQITTFLFAAISLISCKKNATIEPKSSTETLTMGVRRPDLLMSTLAPQSKLTDDSSLKLGINGHLGDAPYLNVPWAKQIDMLKERGLSYYRINVQTTSDGTASSAAHFSTLLDAAEAQHVQILPMLYLRTLDYWKSEKENYSRGRILGENFAIKYGTRFIFYNLGNDEELPIIYKYTTGIKPEHYDPIKFKAVAAYLKGMDEGIKAKDPDAKTIIGAGWLHYGFLKMCEGYGIKFDRIGYNWYSDMENAAPKAPYYITDITQTLAKLFPDKPLWFTEYNYRYKLLSLTNEADQNEFITRFTAKCKANPHVKVMMIYELFDEPYKSIQEAAYGVIKWRTQYSAWENKIVSKTLLAHLID